MDSCSETAFASGHLLLLCFCVWNLKRLECKRNFRHHLLQRSQSWVLNTDMLLENIYPGHVSHSDLIVLK
jgi:hypothetical protein